MGKLLVDSWHPAALSFTPASKPEIEKCTSYWLRGYCVLNSDRNLDFLDLSLRPRCRDRLDEHTAGTYGHRAVQADCFYCTSLTIFNHLENDIDIKVKLVRKQNHIQTHNIKNLIHRDLRKS